MTSLRVRLVLSHVLPSILIIPIMGIVLIYVLENQFLLPTLKNDLLRDARLLASLTHDQSQIWQDPAYAQELLARISPGFIERTMLLRPDGHLLASTDPSDGVMINRILRSAALEEVQAGKEVVRVTYNPHLRGEVVDVLTPVIRFDNQVEGIVRLTYHYDTVYEELVNLRIPIVMIFIVGLVSSLLIGSTLALQVSQPIRKVTQAIFDVARGYRKKRVEERSPGEIQLLAKSVNFLVERLESLEQARRQLLANLVHELGRPIGALQAANQAILKGAYREPELFEELRMGMDEEFGRLLSILEDLNRLNDQSLGSLELNRQPVNPNEWLPKVLRPWREAALEKDIRWEVKIPRDLPTITIDPLRMAQCIGNLISNAIKYTPSGGMISVSMGTEKGGFWIRIQDTGLGIAQEQQEKIFSPFYRVDEIRQSTPGMGLGLSIARDMAIAHGGEIRVESTPGLGSSFTIWIPRELDPVE